MAINEKIAYLDVPTTLNLHDAQTAYLTYDTLIGSTGTDSVTSGIAGDTAFTKIDLGAGNDTFTWQGQTNFTSIDGGTGTDTFVLANGGTLDLKTLTGVANFEVFEGTTNADVITGKTDGTQFAAVDLSGGDDTFTWMGEDTYQSINGGAGTDTFIMGVGGTLDLKDITGVINFEGFEGSTNADVIIGKTDGTQFATVDLKAGDDTFTWMGETTYQSIDGGTGNDTFVFATAATIDLNTSSYGTNFSNFETLTGSAYNDVVTGNTDGTQFATVNLAGGNDTFTWAGEMNYKAIDGGAGTDTFIVASTGGTLDLRLTTGITNFEVFQGSTNADFVTGKTDGSQFAAVDLAGGNDTFTWMGEDTYKSINGGAGTDTFIMGVGGTLDLKDITGVTNFEGFEGSTNADVITGKTNGTQFVTVDLKAGDDTFTWMGETTYQSIDGGTGNDTFVFATAATIDLNTSSYGTNFSNFETLTGSGYNDVVTGDTDGTQFATVNLADGNDTFTWMGEMNYKAIDGGAGTDTFIVASTGGTLDLRLTTGITNFEVLQGSTNADFVTGKTDGSQFAAVDLAGGNDTFTWMGEATYKSINGGAGTDTFIMGVGGTLDLKDITGVTNFEGFEGSTNADVITGKTDGTQFVTVDLKAGNDTFTWMGETSYTSIDGGAGNDTFVFATAATIDLTGGTLLNNFETLTGSNYNDVVIGETNGTQFATVNLADGNDTFTWAGETNYKAIDGGAGTDTFIVASTGGTLDLRVTTGITNFEVFQGSTNADFVIGKTDGSQFAAVDLKEGNDTFTWMGEATYKSINGGAGTDTFIMNAGGTLDLKDITGVTNFEVFQGSTNADVITGKTDGTQFATVNLDGGNDTFTWMGETSYTSIDGGVGNDTFVFATAATIDLADAPLSNFETLTGSNYNDVVIGETNGTQFATVNLAGGNDTFTWMGETNYKAIDGGTGTDTFIVASTGGTLDLREITGITNFEVFQGSTNADFVIGKTDGSQFAAVDLKEGNDTFTWMGEATYKSINGGAGTDTFIMGAGGTLNLKDITGITNFEIFQGSTNADVITGKTDGTQFATVNLDGGNDTFTWMGETSYTSIDGGAGNDTFVFATAAVVDFTASFGSNFKSFEYLVGSDYADTVTGSTEVATVNLQSGNDTFIWKGETNYTSVDGGAGAADTLVLGSAQTIDLTANFGTTFVNFEQLTGSTGNDEITYSSSYSVIDLSTGGSDVLNFASNGWGTSTVTVDYGSQYTTTSELDFLGLNISGVSGNQFTFNVGTSTAYIATATEVDGNLTIDFGTSGLGSIVLKDGDQDWTSSGLAITSTGSGTTYWTGSEWSIS